MLSRLAEAVFWTGRYLERAECTARLVQAHTELFLDLPRSVGLTFVPLLALTGSEDVFTELGGAPTEENVVAHLVAEPSNPSSIVASLTAARDNMRTTRQLFPRESWESINLLHLWATAQAEECTNRTVRTGWLTAVSREVQQLTGLLAGAMSHDETYVFLRLGRHLERADMTTRVLDVRATTLLAVRDDALRPYADVQWVSVLRSLSAYQMYRRKVHARVQGPEVLRFLLQDEQFPRSVRHCLTQIGTALPDLPRHEVPLATSVDALEHVTTAEVRALAWDGLHEFVDDLQGRLAAIHDAVDETWFRPEDSTPADAVDGQPLDDTAAAGATV
ncbi:MAG: alpha-E domain-containing protein [Acidimicrobiia bacterium]|nr:alpha-E domain-containing protein [Acidimicrobiia bacterium]